MTDDDWTPYGLESIRQQRLWRRRLAVAALAVVVALAYVGLLQYGVQEQATTSINTLGGGGGTITLDNPGGGQPTPDATVGISPGELSAQPATIQAGDDGGSEPAAPQDQGAALTPINWGKILVQWGLPAALLLAGYLLGRGRGDDHEVNYGVYKGAMPMETISARYSHLVETTRATYQDPFGKRRSHYLPDEADAADGVDTPSDGNHEP